MFKEKIRNLYLPIGLAILGCTFGIGLFVKIPDFLEGFLKGIGITWAIAGIFMFKSRKKGTGLG